MSWQFDDKPLLTHLFGSFLPLSIDIQKVLLDYLFQREVIAFQKDGVPSYLRFGPVLMSGEVAYEIRAYNENESHVFSTFGTNDNFGTTMILNSFKDEIQKNHKINWHDISLKTGIWYNYRYTFSPVTRWTYIIRNAWEKDRVIISRRSPEGWLLQIRYIKTTDVQAKIIEACELIKKYGEELDSFPDWVRFEEGLKMERNVDLIGRKSVVIL